MTVEAIRNLVVVLGDQLDPEGSAFDGFDPARDRAWMAEVAGEADHVWSHKARIAVFLAAMRHFRDALVARGRPVEYRALDDHDAPTLEQALADRLAAGPVARVIWERPGDYRVAGMLEAACRAAGVAFEQREDRHFVSTLADFERWLGGRREVRLEHWYRHLRRQTGLLMDGDRPAGGRWNFDRSNRRAFGRRGPGLVPPPPRFEPDAVTREVLATVERRFPDHPGRLESFAWPVTRAQAETALEAFVRDRLAAFGPWQDAMWTGEPFLHHSLLSVGLNLHLLDPLAVCRAAEAAWARGDAPIESVEGFVRQVLGWREFVRGLYWSHMPDWEDWNALEADAPLPGFFWTAETDMACLAEVLGQTLEHGHAHHIQRLMVTGLFCLLLGVEPRQVHRWYLAVFVDAVEWVELPNTLGMSQYADGGLMGSKPYVASGRYIQRMSDYCDGCPFDPGRATGEGACPFTTLYWDFLERHAGRFARHPRTALQWRNRERKSDAERTAIRQRAARLRAAFDREVSP